MSPVKVVVDPSSMVVTTPVTVRPEASVSRRCTWAPVTRVTLSWASTGSTQITCASDLPSTRHGKPSTRSQRMHTLPRAATPGWSSTEIDADGQVERVEPELLQVVAQLLDAGLVGDRREGVLRARCALTGVLAVLAVHEVEVLGLRVVGLEVVVGDRPGRRDATVVAKLAEVLRPQPEERCAIELGVPADVVVHLGLELAALPVVPDV